MPRTGKIRKRLVKPDPIYENRLVTKIINKVMKDGKKSIAQKHIYKTLDILKERTKEDPLIILRQAIDNVKP